MKRGRCFSGPLWKCKRLCYSESRSSCGSNNPGVSKMSANEASSSNSQFRFTKGHRVILKGYIIELNSEANSGLPDWDALFAKFRYFEPKCSITQIVNAIRKLQREDMRIRDIIHGFGGDQDAVLDAKAKEDKARRRSVARTSSSHGAGITSAMMANIQIENSVHNVEESVVNNNGDGRIWNLAQCFENAQNHYGMIHGTGLIRTIAFFEDQGKRKFYMSLNDDQRKTILVYLNSETPICVPYLSHEAKYPGELIQETQILNEHLDTEKAVDTHL